MATGVASHRSRDRKRTRSSNISSSSSSSSSDSESDTRDHRRRKDKKKKKHKKKKKKHRRRASSSESEREDGGVDHVRATVVVQTLLLEFPSISSELLTLLQMLEDGETAVISGITNKRIKTLLGQLFSLLGLKKLRKPDDAYVAHRNQRSSLLETVATMLASATTTDTVTNAGPVDLEEEKEDMPRRREAPIGPTMPPSFQPPTSSTNVEEEDDDDLVGPALPGMKGYREADERVEAEMARRAKQLEEDEWRRARGETAMAATTTTMGGREAWMTEMPDNNKIFSEAMGPMKPRTGQPAAFRSKEPAKIDSTWFDSPEERERAKRAKLDMELLGYVRPENAPAPGTSDQAGRATKGASSVNESIMPSANPEADEDMRRQMDVLKQKRGPSLLEQHQQKIAEQQKEKGGPTERTTWNRERDLTARRGLSQADADRIIQASKDIGSKFTAPTVSRQFL